MIQLQKVLDFIHQYEILLFLVYVLLSLISAFIIDKIFITTLKKIVKKTKSDIDDKLIDVLHPAIYNTILYLGFYVALSAITIPGKIEFILQGLLKSLIVIYWSLGIFKSFGFLHFLL